MLAGRLAAEAETAFSSLLLTLTYRPLADGTDPEGARRVMLEDARAFRASLNNVKGRDGQRKAGRDNKYCIVGELGEQRGRAHFHAALFFAREASQPGWADLPERVERDYWFARNLNPQVKEFTCCGVRVEVGVRRKTGETVFRAHIPEWPHGHVDIRRPDYGGFSYIAKYMLKTSEVSTLDGHSKVWRTESFIVRSRDLGLCYIRQYGEEFARQGLEPTDTLYRISSARFRRGARKGQMVRFTMTRTLRRECLMAYCRERAFMIASADARRLAARAAGRPDRGPASWAINGELVGEFVERVEANSPYLAAGTFAAHFTAPEGKLDRRTPRRRTIKTDFGGTLRLERLPDGAFIERTVKGVVRVVWRDSEWPFAERFGLPLMSRKEVRLVLDKGGGVLLARFPDPHRERARREWEIMSLRSARARCPFSPRAFGIPFEWPMSRPPEDEQALRREFPLWAFWLQGRAAVEAVLPRRVARSWPRVREEVFDATERAGLEQGAKSVL